MTPPSAKEGPRRRRSAPPLDLDELFAPQRTPSSSLPDPVPLLHALTRGVLEVLAGTREVDQLSRWLAEEPYRSLLRRANLARRARSARRIPTRRPVFTVRSIHHMSPADGVAEATVIVSMPDRTRAIALRLEGIDGRWRATDLRIL